MLPKPFTMGRFEVNFGLYGYTVDGCTGVGANMLKDCTPKNRAFIAKVLARRLRQLGREKRYGKVAPA